MKKLCFMLLIFLLLLIGCQSKEKDINNIYYDSLSFELNYEIKTAKKFYSCDIIKIDTYEEYLNIIKDNSHDYYDEDFFKTSSLILFGRKFPSGSIQCTITSLEFINSNIIINVSTFYPSAGTCDIKSLQYIIEYVKPIEVKNIHINEEIIEENGIEFVINEEEVEEAKEFIKAHDDSIYYTNVYVFFSDNFNRDGKNKDEIKAYYVQYNSQNIERYELERIGVIRYVPQFSPIISIEVNEIVNLDFDLLLDIASQNGINAIYLCMMYIEISYNYI